MAARRPYERTNRGAWGRNPRWLRYFLREATCVFVAVYALIVLVGLVRLAQGEAAYAGWVEALRSPASLVLHALLFAAFAYHTASWFTIMPMTMPPVVIAGRRLSGAAIAGAGIAMAIACSTIILGVIAWLAR